MHVTTKAFLIMLKAVNNDNKLTPTECWHKLGPFVLEWRKAGHPDAPIISGGLELVACGYLIMHQNQGVLADELDELDCSKEG